MALIATQDDFEGGWYTEYRRYPFFAERAQLISERFSGKILVAGCGPGYLVDELVKLGLDAYGFDASVYAIDTAAVIPDRMTKADVLNAANLDSVLSLAGLGSDETYSVCVTEELMGCMESDTEVSTALTNLRGIADSLFHVITCSDIPGRRDPQLNWKTHQKWKALINNNELIFNQETKKIL